MRPRPPNRRSLRFALCVALGAAVLGLQWLRTAEHGVVGPIDTEGRRSAAVATDEFTVEVTDVRVTGTVTDTSGLAPQPVEANGVWVVVWVRVTATGTTLDATSAELVMADRTTYSPSLWFRDALDGDTAFPAAVPVHGAFVFEVPEDRLDRPSLALTHVGGADPRLAARATVGLGIDAADVAGDRSGVTLTPPERRPEEAAEVVRG
ncbi:hypothetical protein [Nocardiopsis sp. FIRDI 009]|uniref:hypothetical protein n=1 Tax=Nocardiopsis sp. FIRDI 009 TaxID=714197 RepID=UPI000E241A24|nr:hypothetical protein [Nocardiopsis sp. FIRDI 009]